MSHLPDCGHKLSNGAACGFQINDGLIRSFVSETEMLASLLLVSLCFSVGSLAEYTSCTPPPNTELLCQANNCTLVEDNAILCCHMRSDFSLKEAIAVATSKGRKINSLHLYNLTFGELDASITKRFNFDTITVTNGSLKLISGEFLNITKCLNFSGNAISVIKAQALASLDHLQTLDLSRNNITTLPNIVKSVYNLSLDLSENGNLSCRSLQDFINGTKDHHIGYKNINNTFCNFHAAYNWFRSSSKLSMLQLELYVKIEQECPPGCRCSIDRMLYNSSSQYVGVGTDCSNQQLTSFPSQIPQYTAFLNLSNNNISSLGELNNPMYDGIVQLYLDNNYITSINELEGTKFIETFTILSLRNNRIKSVPTYFLADSFKRNYAARHFNLAGNRLTCDCNTAQALKSWFLSYKQNLPEVENVMCDNLQKRVVDIQLIDVCIHKRAWTDYISYIIAGEVILLLLLVSKVSYDYWVFKTAGYLPWPASRLPKLPCDWVFET